MNIQPVHFQPLTFKADLKRMFDKGELPTVKKGFYGMPLDKKNVSREHLLPKSKGGATKEANIVLADKFINWQRSSQPLTKFAHEKEAVEYLEQFKGVVVPGHKFNGNRYIETVTKTLKRLGMDITEQVKQMMADTPGTVKDTVKHLDLKA
jgi:hypothetical protein